MRSQAPGAAHVVIDGLNAMRGGTVVVIARAARALRDAGASVTVLLARELPGLTLDDDIAVHLLPRARGAVPALLARRLWLDRLLRRLGADLVLSLNYSVTTSVPQATYHINVIPFLPQRQRAAAVGAPRAVVQAIEARRALRHSATNVFESRYVMKLARELGVPVRRPQVAYVGIDLPYGAAPAAPEPHSFVTITSPAPHKRNDLLLDAFSTYAASHPEARLTVIGDADAILSSLAPERRRVVEADAAIEMTGYLGRAALFDRIARSWAMLVASELESFFMVPVEAMTYACPVIGFDSTSIRESVGPEMPVVPMGDIAGMVREMERLSNSDVREALSAAALAWSTRFAADVCSRDLAEKILSVLPGSAASPHGADRAGASP